MNLQRIVSQMTSNAQAIRTLVEDCPEQQARWKPDAASWSILEVINHLLDEEREDFRARIDMALQGSAWFRIDPEAWVVERGYNQRELDLSLEAFLVERERSLEWLSGVGKVDWEMTYQAPFGPIRVGDFLVSWAAHDVLHIRQLVELKWAYLVQEMVPYSTRYAGEC
jgi:hypothetical protein